eukprot:349751-Chlamydomonas_euryale.AAC.7
MPLYMVCVRDLAACASRWKRPALRWRARCLRRTPSSPSHGMTLSRRRAKLASRWVAGAASGLLVGWLTGRVSG